jgi:hypothetical protein
MKMGVANLKYEFDFVMLVAMENDNSYLAATPEVVLCLYF